MPNLPLGAYSDGSSADAMCRASAILGTSLVVKRHLARHRLPHAMASGRDQTAMRDQVSNHVATDTLAIAPTSERPGSTMISGTWLPKCRVKAAVTAPA